MTETRDTKSLRLHTLKVFAFLEADGFVASHTSTSTWFTVDYTNGVNDLSIKIGTFLPRYEYYVAIACCGQRIGLDEIGCVIDPTNRRSVDWTWAHSDPTEFCKRISFSANLLQRHLPEIKHGFQCIREKIVKMREKSLEDKRLEDCANAADNAFREGRWSEALEIYRNLPNFNPVQKKTHVNCVTKGIAKPCTEVAARRRSTLETFLAATR